METLSPGARALNEAHSFLSRFAAFPSAAAQDAVVLWAAHTHAVNAFSASPRLAVLSDQPASGKSRVLELCAMLSHDSSIEIDITGPALIAMISQRQPTIFMDEIDCVFGVNGGDSHRSLRAVLNGGYKGGATVTRRSGGAFVQEKIYSPIAFGGLGILPATLMSRSVVIRMAQRKPEQKLEAFMPRTHTPAGLALGVSLGSWVSSVALELATAYPALPDGVADRAAECWEPLLAIADQAGGSWPERAREACTELALERTAEPARTPGQRILGDLRTIWGTDANMPTAEIVRRLYALESAPWAKLWGPAAAPRELSALLAPYGVRPVKVRVDASRTAQGYRRLDLEPHWDVPSVPERNAQDQTESELIGV